jgi:hypothetical protein
VVHVEHHTVPVSVNAAVTHVTVKATQVATLTNTELNNPNGVATVLCPNAGTVTSSTFSLNNLLTQFNNQGGALNGQQATAFARVLGFGTDTSTVTQLSFNQLIATALCAGVSLDTIGGIFQGSIT